MTPLVNLTPGMEFGGDFVVVRPLAQGGMGAVYVVRQRSTQKERALKILHPEFVRDPQTRSQFVQEATIGSAIDSDHVVDVVAAGIDAATNTPWIAMELLHGEELGARLARLGALAPAEVKELLDQLCDALSRAHAKGIVHRDLKPENLFVADARRKGVPFTLKVLDFGIAKVAAASSTSAKVSRPIGSPLWMAPEQARLGAALTPATDVWALGLITFALLTGRFYWRAAQGDIDLMVLFNEVLVEPLEPASQRAREYGVERNLPPGFDGWFARCVVRDTAARFSNAAEAWSSLAPLLTSASGGAAAVAPTLLAAMPMPTPPQVVAPPRTEVMPGTLSPVAHTVAAAPPPGVVEAPPRRARSKAPWAVGLAVLAAAGVGVAAFATRSNTDAPPAPRAASSSPEQSTAPAPPPAPAITPTTTTPPRVEPAPEPAPGPRADARATHDVDVVPHHPAPRAVATVDAHADARAHATRADARAARAATHAAAHAAAHADAADAARAGGAARTTARAAGAGAARAHDHAADDPAQRGAVVVPSQPRSGEPHHQRGLPRRGAARRRPRPRARRPRGSRRRPQDREPLGPLTRTPRRRASVTPSMVANAVLFDLDGTLVDTNDLHTRAFQEAFASRGYKAPADRVFVEIGKGGDNLVPAIIGRDGDAADGDAIREAQPEAFARVAAAEGIEVFPGAEALIAEVKRRGLKTVIATSSQPEQLERVEEHSGVAWRERVDAAVLASDVKQSKPAPDVVSAAVKKLKMSPAQCVMVGDTPYDAEAARHAGVVLIGLTCGGHSRETLLSSGARMVFRDPADLVDHLDEALAMASPGSASFTQELLESLMREALAEAEAGLRAGEVPVGCVIARGDGTIVARGHNEGQRLRTRTAHAEMVALSRAAGRFDGDARDAVMVATLEPCVMCLGAAMQTATDLVVYGLRAPADSGTGRVTPPTSPEAQMPRVVGGVLAAESRALFERWSALPGRDPKQRAFVEQLLSMT
ncbi:MAG: HAD-IA family hydrolase [Polyangiales bacterium]